MKKRDIEEQYFYIADVLVVLITQYFMALIDHASGNGNPYRQRQTLQKPEL